VKKIGRFIKKRWSYIVVALIVAVIFGNCGPSQSDIDKANAKVKQDTTKIDALDKQISSLQKDNKNLQAKVDQAGPWFKMSAEEQKQKEAEAKAAEAKAKAAAEAKAKAQAKAKAVAAATAKAQAEAKAKQGYNTGITYNQLARNPDKYTDEKVKFYGEVVQVIEGDDNTTQIRLAVNGNYDTILFAQFDNSIVKSRVLENDKITIYGTSTGLVSYDSTMGGKISIPGVSIDKID
jgi:hypothetical protein